MAVLLVLCAVLMAGAPRAAYASGAENVPAAGGATEAEQGAAHPDAAQGDDVVTDASVQDEKAAAEVDIPSVQVGSEADDASRARGGQAADPHDAVAQEEDLVATAERDQRESVPSAQEQVPSSNVQDQCVDGGVAFR